MLHDILFTSCFIDVFNGWNRPELNPELKQSVTPDLRHNFVIKLHNFKSETLFQF